MSPKKESHFKRKGKSLQTRVFQGTRGVSGKKNPGHKKKIKILALHGGSRLLDSSERPICDHREAQPNRSPGAWRLATSWESSGLEVVKTGLVRCMSFWKTLIKHGDWIHSELTEGTCSVLFDMTFLNAISSISSTFGVEISSHSSSYCFSQCLSPNF